MGLVADGSVLDRISEDLEAINEAYGLLSAEQKDMLLRDIEYLFLDNIVKEVRFVFYDPRQSGAIFRQHVYAPGDNRRLTDLMDSLKGEVPSGLVFDVFVEFTEGFLQLEPEEQRLLLGNTEREWYTYE